MANAPTDDEIKNEYAEIRDSLPALVGSVNALLLVSGASQNLAVSALTSLLMIYIVRIKRRNAQGVDEQIEKLITILRRLREATQETVTVVYEASSDMSERKGAVN